MEQKKKFDRSLEVLVEVGLGYAEVTYQSPVMTAISSMFLTYSKCIQAMSEQERY